MTRAALIAAALSALGLHAQLIPAGSPIPRTTLPPVVFINGFQFEGCPTTFSSTFGIADQVLQANGEASVFFNTCSSPSTASIEDLGAAFGTFLAGLKYTDGTAVDQVDVVAHSMGGLVLRCYLSGKQNTAETFEPPAATHIRKAVFLATPNFGTPIAQLLPIVTQVNEMSSGSEFLFDLGTWNDATDDLYGVDAIAAAGNGGTGLLTQTTGFDDGVVPLTSASLRFYGPGRTRVLPYCHTSGGGLVSDVGLCPPGAKGIADIDSASHLSAQIIVSFLDGTNAWQSVGTAPENDPFLSGAGGLIVEARDANDSKLNIESGTASILGAESKLGISSDHLGFLDQFVAANPLTLVVTSGTTTIQNNVTLPAGGYEAYTVETGPLIARVYPAAAATFPLEVAPRMIVSIYGTDLADAEVLVGAEPITVLYRSSTQINAVLPDPLAGLIKLTVQNATGKSTINLYVGTAAPAIFTLDSSGTGPAAALKAPQLTVVTADNPLHAGDSVALYLTGLGHNGLDVPFLQPAVTVGGEDCPVSFAGPAPGFLGLDQINCAIPAGVTGSAVPVVVTSATRISNTATLAIQ